MGHSWNALALNLVVWLFYLQPLHPRQVSSHKVGGSEMVTIFQLARFSYNMKHDVRASPVALHLHLHLYFIIRYADAGAGAGPSGPAYLSNWMKIEAGWDALPA